MEIETVVAETLRKALGPLDDVEHLSKNAHPDWDSLVSIAILFELEERFQLEFSDQQIEMMTSYSAICDIVKQLKLSD